MRHTERTKVGMTLKTRMLSGFIASAALAGVVGVMGIIALNRTNATINEYIRLGSGAGSARQISIAMLQGRRDEKDFLMRLDPKYAEAVKNDVALLITNARQFKTALPPTDRRQPELDSLIKLAGDYQADFLDVVKTIQTRGTLDTGIYGTFRAKAHDVEADVSALGSVQLERDYLEIRRNEKDYLLRLDPTYITQAGANIEVFKNHLARSGVSPAGAARMGKLWDEYANLLDQLQKIDTTIAAGTETYRATVHEIEPLLESFVVESEQSAQTSYDAVVALKNLVMILIAVTIAVAVAAALLLGMLLSNNVTRQVGGEPAEIADLARRVADGDLAMNLNDGKRKSTGIFGAIKDMIGRLNDVMRNVQDASAQVASSSEEISSAAQQLASGAQGQASTLEETSASVEELTASVEQVSDHAQSQAASVEQTSSNVAQMQGAVQQVSKTLNDVAASSQESMQKAQSGAQAVTEAVKAIEAISGSSEQIAGIVTVISDIADQTNLLALNASHRGGAGRGARAGFCRGGRRGVEARRAQRLQHQGNRGADQGKRQERERGSGDRPGGPGSDGGDHRRERRRPTPWFQPWRRTSISRSARSRRWPGPPRTSAR